MRLRDGSAFVDVYGDMPTGADRSLRHPEDPHRLFAAKAIGLTINEPNGHDAARSQWVPADSGTAESGGNAGLVAWFQVSVLADPHAARPLPTQALVECAGAVTTRMGLTRLRAVRVLLPLDRHASGAVGLASSVAWFPDDSHPVSVVCSLDSGEGQFATHRWPEVLDVFRRRQTGGFGLHGEAEGTGGTTRPITAARDEMWLGAGDHLVALDGSLPEWSVESVGWMLAQLADCAWEAGARESIAIEVAAAG